MTVLEWDFRKLSTVEYQTERYEISEPYDSILIVTSGADVVLSASKSENSSVVCYEQKKMKHTVSVKEGTLIIEVSNTKKWYDHIEINFDITFICHF